jgi:hypothetical protein
MAEVAGEVKLLLTADGTSWSQALDKAQRDLNKLKGSTSDAARHTRAEMTEARHAIHLVGDEFGIHLPRAVQGFVATLPGVAEAMSAAFSTLAIVGIGMAIFETGKKVVEFIEKTRKAAEEAERATKHFSESRHLANLEMEVANAKLDEQIAKLEKRPGDALKTSLAEARAEAFKLGVELGKDVEEMHKLIEEKLTANWMQRVAMGAAGSEGTLEQLDEYGAKLERISKIIDPVERTAAMKEETSTKLGQLHEEITARTELQGLEHRMAHRETGEISPADLSRILDLRKRFSGGADATDQTAALRGLNAFHEMVQDEYNSAADTEARMGKEARLRKDQGIKDQEELNKAGIEALKRQTAERLAVMENELAEEKTLHLMSTQEEIAFWQKRYQTGTNLADPINAMIQKRIAPLTQEGLKKQASEAKEWLAMMNEFQGEANRAFEKRNPFAPDRAEARNQGETDAARMAALYNRPELLRRIREAQEELNASEMVQAGTMEKGTEAILQQTHVLARLRDELADLEGKRAAVAALPRAQYTPTMNPEALENQIMQERAEVGAAAQTLQYQTERDTFGGEMRALFTDWTRRATDLRQTIAGLFDQAVSTVNSAIVKTMVDPYHRGDWKSAGKSIASSVAGAGLSAAEGSILKAFHIGGGKLGTQQNPMWVRDAGTAVGNTLSSSLMAGLTGAGSGGTTGAVGSGVWKAVGSLLGAIPFMASGGTLDTGMPAIVGEAGPELFVPSGSGRIIPNSALGGTSHVWNIDARGSSDPAATRFAVQRAILDAAPRIAAGSIAASRDLAARKPQMLR